MANSRPAAALCVLTDASPHLQGISIRLIILSSLPDADIFAFYTTCSHFRDTVHRQNQLAESDAAEAQGYVARTVKPPPSEHVVTSIALVEWAKGNGWTWPSIDWRGGGACALAAAAGSLDVLMLAREEGCPWNWWTCAQAALNGHLAVLQWARAQGCPWSAQSCSAVAHANGHDEVVAFITASS